MNADPVRAQVWLVEVTTHGEIGYLKAETRLDWRTLVFLVPDDITADKFATQERAQRAADRFASRFDTIRVVPAQS